MIIGNVSNQIYIVAFLIKIDHNLLLFARYVIYFIFCPKR